MNPHITMAQRRAANRRAHSPSHEGRAPRTLEEAFPQFPGADYEEPSLNEKVWDVIAIVAAVAVFGLMAYAGAGIFGA